MIDLEIDPQLGPTLDSGLRPLIFYQRCQVSGVCMYTGAYGALDGDGWLLVCWWGWISKTKIVDWINEWMNGKKKSVGGECKGGYCLTRGVTEI